MSEISFAKSFLATLDKKAIKLAADHVSDPKKYPNQSPFILPKQTHPFPRRQQPTSTPATPKTLTATLKPMRSGDTITITDISTDSSIHDVKTQYAQKSSQPLEKIKLLLNKKPAADLKTLKELGIESDVEFTVMLMSGGATTPGAGTPTVASPAVEVPEPKMPVPAPAPAADKIDVDAPAPESEKAQAEAVAAAPVDDGAEAMLKGEEFWTDLKGFLKQRLRDDGVAEEVCKKFRGSL